MKRAVTLILAGFMCLSVLLYGCGSGSQTGGQSSTGAGTTKAGSEAPTQAENSKLIANRVIRIKHFQVGITLPANQEEAAVFKKIKELTGVQVQIEAMKGQDIIQDLSVALAAGDLPDVITGYCEGTNDTKNADLVKMLARAATDGTFVDLKPYLEKTTKYKKFLDTNYLTKDAKENIVMRPDFNGAMYLLQMEIPRPDVPTAVWIGGAGLYIRNDIAKALGVDPATIQTNEDLYELAKKIKAGDFKDGDGNPCLAPIGPTIWDRTQDPSYAAPEFDFGNSSNFDYDKDGVVKHILLTDYAYKAVEAERKLIAEGLLAKEAYSIKGQQATEGFANAKYPIMYMHAFSQSWDGGSDVLRSKNKDKMYVPLGPMKNNKGSTEKLAVRRGNTFVAIPKTTEKPEEVVKFLDWCASAEGERLIGNGIEGVHYTLEDRKNKEYLNYTQPDADDDGKDPIPTKENTDNDAKDKNYKYNEGIAIAPLTYLSHVDLYKDLAATFGLGAGDQFPFDYGRQMLKQAAPQAKVIDGLPAGGVLEGYSDIKRLKPVLDVYQDTIVKAIYAKSDDDAKKILDAYKKQLIDAGVENAAKYLQDMDQKNPGSVIFYLTK